MTDWVMKVPVLATAHVPVDFPFGCDDIETARIDGGWFVAIGEVDNDHPVLGELAAWSQKHFPGEYWIRLDHDGDRIEDLPEYEW